MEVIKNSLLKPYLSKGSVAFWAVIFSFGILFPTKFAEAAWWNPLAWGGDVVLNGIMAVLLNIPGLMFLLALQLILSLTSFISWIVGAILAAVIKMDIPLTGCPDSAPGCVVDAGWLFSRDIVNMLLIVALVIIALATMYRWEGYGFKKALLPLIGVALLVNFSKVIVGVVVDMSTIIMQIFLNEITGMQALATSFSTQGELFLNQLAGLKFLTLSGNIAFVFKTIILIIFQLGFAFILGLFTLIFLARYIALWLITILSPIALAAYIFPSTKKLFNLWREQLVSWSLIGVTAGFFLWLGKLFTGMLGGATPLKTQFSNAFTADLFASNPFKEFIVELMPYAMLIIFLFAAFALSLKTNAMGASMIMAQAKKLKDKAVGLGIKGLEATARTGLRIARTTGKERLGRLGGAAARRAMETRIGKAVRKRMPTPWKPGAERRRYDKKKNRKSMLRRAGLLGQNGRSGRPITENTPWGALTPDQQVQLKEQNRNRLAKKAAKVLGPRARGAKHLASSAWNELTLEEQNAIKQVVFLKKLREAERKAVDKWTAYYKDLGLSTEQLDDTLRKETDKNKRRALEKRILDEGRVPSTMQSEFTLDTSGTVVGITDKGKQWALDMARLKQDAAIYAEFPELIKQIYSEPLKQAQKMKEALQIVSKEVKEHRDAMLEMESSQVAEIARSGKTRKERLAATQLLADKLEIGAGKALADADAEKIIDLARKFNQEHLILKRYLTKTENEDEMKKVMGKMSDQDYRLAHKDILDIVKNKTKFEEFYKYASSEGIGQMMANKDLNFALQKLWMDAANEALLKSREDINTFIVKRSRGNTPLSIKVDLVYTQ